MNRSDEFEQISTEYASSDAYINLVNALEGHGEKRKERLFSSGTGSVYIFHEEEIWVFRTMGHRKRTGYDDTWLRHFWIACGGFRGGEPAQDHFYEINPPWSFGSADSKGLFLKAGDELFLARKGGGELWSRLATIDAKVDGKSTKLSFLASMSDVTELTRELARVYWERRRLRIAARSG